MTQLSLFTQAEPPTLRHVARAAAAGGSEALPGVSRLADQARYLDIAVRSALSEARGMPFRWTLNPYRGCTHGCAYCYARKYQPQMGLGMDDFSAVIMIKENLPAVLQREVGHRNWSRELVAVGTATDAYQPIEGTRRLTRACLEVLTNADTPYSIVTKGTLVLRDVDILQQASRRAGCRVYMSVPSIDMDAWRRLEPGTASPTQRLAVARRLHEAGIETSILMMPLVPGITTSMTSLERTIRAIAESGVPLGGAGIARLDAGVRDYFLEFLEREYPTLADGYRRLYQTAYAPGAYVAGIKRRVEAVRRRFPDAGPRPIGVREALRSGPESRDESRTDCSDLGPKTAS